MGKNYFSKEAQECARYIIEASSIVVLSGAGLSTSAGIPDFRGPQGIYRRLGISNPEKIFDIEFFQQNPSFFYNFHREFLGELVKISPTYTHFFLAALERKGKILGIITQNIDSLHQKAGSQKVYEMHGGIHHTYCTSCNKHYGFSEAMEKTMTEDVPRCSQCGGVLKPDIVFFGEGVKHLSLSEELARESDLFFVLGSSLTVTPAAFLPGISSGKVIVVNQGPFSTSYLSPRKTTLHVDSDLDSFFREVNRELHTAGFPVHPEESASPGSENS
ncbi:MAG TPA: Sir2 family NAD-dependent protein deacetylase [Synergistaceae bacterium]|nr:Sir2 family NAD-dependent protein deacetylase [Synergistaceae bacterium]